MFMALVCTLHWLWVSLKYIINAQYITEEAVFGLQYLS